MGRAFNFSELYLNSIGLPFTKFVTTEEMELNVRSISDFVFVTAATEDHFKEAETNIGDLVKKLPSAKVIFYDLGISKGNKAKFSSPSNSP